MKNDITGKEIIDQDDHSCLIEIGAGENWHDFVLWAIEEGLGGIENLSLIPGTVGAAPIQNIGAYGVEIKETFDSLTAYFLETGEKRIFTKEDCNFGYRDSVFKGVLKGKVIITKVRLRLTKSDHKINTSYGAISKTLEEWKIPDPDIRDVSKAVIAIRQSKLPDPAELGNSGSFFKNPEITKHHFSNLKEAFPHIVSYDMPSGLIKVPAGWLIEQCGWKGKVVGNVGCYEKQALVIVNYGGADPQEIVDLSKEIQKSVEGKFGISLEQEVTLIS